MIKRTTTLAVPAGILATALMVMMASVAWADFASIVLGRKIRPLTHFRATEYQSLILHGGPKIWSLKLWSMMGGKL